MIVLMSNLKEYNDLTPEEQSVILLKGTERPYRGEYTDTEIAGTYVCRQCDTPLFRSEDKFHSNCGWPSFDDELPDSVKKIADPDGIRTEIVCAQCDGHLGHIFNGEGFTPKNQRYCVNSISMKLIPDSESILAKAYFGGGCFWGVEHLLQHLEGVESVVSGYMGGEKVNPTYTDVCSGKTGHVEVVEVSYDPEVTTYDTLVRFFFEIHDPTQLNFQGPDRGTQYRSVVFVETLEEKETVQKAITDLKENGFDVVTEVADIVPFYRAEEFHQDYYERKGLEPYCHLRVNRF